MKTDYRLKKRKDRYISVIFKIMPGVEISTKTQDPIEAIKFAERYLADFDSFRSRNKTVQTFEAFAKGFYLQDKHGYKKRLAAKKRHRAEDFWIAREGVLANYWIPKFGKLILIAISTEAIDIWFMDLKGVKGQVLADNTKNKILATGKTVFEEAKRQGLISENPIKSGMDIAEECKTREPFNDIEMAKLFPANDAELMRIWPGQRWILYFLILRDTGWRPGEVISLRMCDYFPDSHGVFTTRNVNRHGEIQNRIKTSDKGKQYKIGYLSELTIRHFEAYMAEEQPAHDRLLFIASKDTGVSIDLANKCFKSSCKRAGVDRGDRTQYCP